MWNEDKAMDWCYSSVTRLYILHSAGCDSNEMKKVEHFPSDVIT
jgi:hypothetical protein